MRHTIDFVKSSYFLGGQIDLPIYKNATVIEEIIIAIGIFGIFPFTYSSFLIRKFQRFFFFWIVPKFAMETYLIFYFFIYSLFYDAQKSNIYFWHSY